MRQWAATLICVLISLISLHCVGGAVFSSPWQLSKLLELEPVVIEMLEEAPELTDKAIHMKQTLEPLFGVATDINHPVSVYQLIRRWFMLDNLFPEFFDDYIAREGKEAGHSSDAPVDSDDPDATIATEPEDDWERPVPRENPFAAYKGVEIPSAFDMLEVTHALLRLQRTYGLLPEEMANGKVLDYTPSPVLQPDDIFFIAALGRDTTDDHAAVAQWFELAGREELKKKKNKEETSASYKVADAYYQLSEMLLKVGDYNSAVEAMYTANENGAKGIDMVQRLLKLSGIAKAHEGMKQPTMLTWRNPSNTWETDNYEKLCRGETVTISPLDPSVLVCRYHAAKGSFVSYKEEVVSWNPYVSIFYDVISDTEIEQLKTYALPKLDREEDAGVTLRIVGQEAWLGDSDAEYGEVAMTLTRRVAVVTGVTELNTDGEPLQIVNYGAGGFCPLHTDFKPEQPEQQHDADEDATVEDLTEEEKAEEQDAEHVYPHSVKAHGDRKATFMFYLNDVTEGGATVFPRIGVRIPPIKKSAVFWYNTTPGGKNDDNTLHAGCPVIIGEKWVANQYIH